MRKKEQENKMKVDYTVLRRSYELYKEEYEEAVLRVMQSGWYILGPEMQAFEKEFAEYMGAKHCIAVNSGTDALILAFRALGIGKGDEVIVPAGTYIASVMGITENGGTPVYVDSDEYLLMDANRIEEQIPKKQRQFFRYIFMDRHAGWIKYENWQKNTAFFLLKTVHRAMVQNLGKNIQEPLEIWDVSVFTRQNHLAPLVMPEQY